MGSVEDCRSLSQTAGCWSTYKYDELRLQQIRELVKELCQAQEAMRPICIESSVMNGICHQVLKDPKVTSAAEVIRIT